MESAFFPKIALLLAAALGAASCAVDDPVPPPAAAAPAAEPQPAPDPVPAAKVPATLDTEADFDEWFYRYYLHPDPDRLVEALAFSRSRGNLGKRGYRRVLSGFVAEVFRQNPDRVEAWAREIGAAGGDSVRLLAASLFLTLTPEARRALVEIGPRVAKSDREEYDAMLSTTTYPVRRMPIQSPEILDLLWATFLASGDPECVRRIASVLPWVDDEGDTGRMLIGGAARWSLASNAHQHDRVLAICREELERQPEPVRVRLREAIASAEELRRKDVAGEGDDGK